MKIIISPAKSITDKNLNASLEATTPQFIDQAEYLVKKLQKFSARKIAKTMNVNEDIAAMNYERFQTWKRPEAGNYPPAIAQFTGEVYRGLEAESMDKHTAQRAQDNLRILSGLYGLMRPFDAMPPYRLEMGTRWAVTPKTKNLYMYWGTKLADTLNEEMKEGEVLVNLASNEYVKAIDKKALKANMITPVFQELKNGQYKSLMTYAKNARGRMTRFILEKNIQNPEELKTFDWDGYAFDVNRSTDSEWIFTR